MTVNNQESLQPSLPGFGAGKSPEKSNARNPVAITTPQRPLTLEDQLAEARRVFEGKIEKYEKSQNYGYPIQEKEDVDRLEAVLAGSEKINSKENDTKDRSYFFEGGFEDWSKLPKNQQKINDRGVKKLREVVKNLKRR